MPFLKHTNNRTVKKSEGLLGGGFSLEDVTTIKGPVNILAERLAGSAVRKLHNFRENAFFGVRRNLGGYVGQMQMEEGRGSFSTVALSIDPGPDFPYGLTSQTAMNGDQPIIQANIKGVTDHLDIFIGDNTGGVVNIDTR